MKRLWTPACIVLHVLLYGAFFAACSYIYYLGATGEEESDLIIHFMRVADMDMASYSFNRYLLYPGYALADIPGAAAILSLYTTLTIAIIEYLIAKLAPRCTLIAALIFAFMANFAIAIFVPFIHSYIYVGVVTGNCWHNSTYITMRVFALLAIMLYLMVTDRLDAPASKAGKAVAFVLFGLCVLVATGIKPSFYAVFAPAIFILCIIDLIREGSRSVPRSLILGVCLAIPLIVVATQYDVLFNQSESAGGIAIGIAVVWQNTNDNIPAAIIQSFAFPIAVLIGCHRQIAKDRNLLFAWVMFLFGFLEYFFVYETGPRMLHGNFAWGLQLGVYYLIAASVIALVNEHPHPLESLRLVLPQRGGHAHAANPSTGERVYVYFCLVLFLLHALSGLLLFATMVAGHSYGWHVRW